MSSTTEQGMRVRFALAVAALLVAGIGSLVLLRETRTAVVEPSVLTLREIFDAAVAQASSQGRPLFVYCYREDELRRRPAIEREVLDEPRLFEQLASRFCGVELAWSETTRRPELPEPLQWWAMVNGGAELAFRDRGHATDYGLGVSWVPSVFVSDSSGAVFEIPPECREGKAEEYCAELLAIADRCSAFERELVAARALAGVERAKALLEAADALGPRVLLSRVPLLREIARADPHTRGGPGDTAHGMLDLHRSAVGVKEVVEVAGSLFDQVSPERMKDTLQPVRDRYAEIVEVQQVADMFQVMCDGRLALHDRQYEEMLTTVEAAIARDERSQVAGQLREIATRLRSRLHR